MRRHRGGCWRSITTTRARPTRWTPRQRRPRTRWRMRTRGAAMKSTARANAWPDADRYELDRGEVACRKLIVASGDAPTLLHLEGLEPPRSRPFSTALGAYRVSTRRNTFACPCVALYDWPRSRSSLCRI